jgi:hypothetical protein
MKNEEAKKKLERSASAKKSKRIKVSEKKTVKKKHMQHITPIKKEGICF